MQWVEKRWRLLFDEIVKNRGTATAVMPAKAGIQKYQPVTKYWTPAFAGVTTFSGGIMFR